MFVYLTDFHLRYNFNKVAQYKQLSLEEAEEKMKNRRKTADGYQRWMMKAANNGPAAFGEAKNFDDEEGGASGRRGHKKTGGDVAEANASDKGEEDEEEEAAGHTILGLCRRGSNDDEETPRGGDLDLDGEDIEKGEHLPYDHRLWYPLSNTEGLCRLLAGCFCINFMYGGMQINDGLMFRNPHTLEELIIIAA